MFILSTARDSSSAVAANDRDLYNSTSFVDDDDDDDDNDDDEDNDDDDDDDEGRRQKQQQHQADQRDLELREQATNQTKELLKATRPIYEEYMPTSPAPSYSGSDVSNRDRAEASGDEEEGDNERDLIKRLISEEIKKHLTASGAAGKQTVSASGVKRKLEDNETSSLLPLSEARKKKKNAKELVKELKAGGLTNKTKKQLASILKQHQQLSGRIELLLSENA